MGDRSPDYCPSCGDALDPVDPPDVHHCASCGENVFHSPNPNARVAVVEGNRVLLVEIADEGRITDPPYDHESEWMLPGGHVELGEHPDTAAARELDEETGLTVDSEDLVLFDAITRQVVEGVHSTVTLYAVARELTSGNLVADEDASDARFWSPSALDASDGRYREIHDEPDRYRDLRGVLDEARNALS